MVGEGRVESGDTRESTSGMEALEADAGMMWFALLTGSSLQC